MAASSGRVVRRDLPPPFEPNPPIGHSSATSEDWLRSQLGEHYSDAFLRLARPPTPALLSASAQAHVEALFWFWRVLFAGDASGNVGVPAENRLGTESAQELVVAARRGLFYDPETGDVFLEPVVEGRGPLVPLRLVLSLENGTVDLARVFSEHDNKEALIELKDCVTIDAKSLSDGCIAIHANFIINKDGHLFRRRAALEKIGALDSAVTLITLRHPNAAIVYAVGTAHLADVLSGEKKSKFVKGVLESREGYKGLELPATAWQVAEALRKKPIDPFFDGPVTFVEPRSQRPGDVLSARIEALIGLHHHMRVGAYGGPPLAAAGSAGGARTPATTRRKEKKIFGFWTGDAFEAVCCRVLAEAIGGVPAGLVGVASVDLPEVGDLRSLVRAATRVPPCVWRNTKELEGVDVMVGAPWLLEVFDRLFKPQMDVLFDALCLLRRLEAIAVRLRVLHRAAAGAEWCDVAGAPEIDIDDPSLDSLKDAVRQLFAVLTVPGDACELPRARLEHGEARNTDSDLQRRRSAAAFARDLSKLSVLRFAKACAAAAKRVIAFDFGFNPWPVDAPQAAIVAALEKLEKVGNLAAGLLDNGESTLAGALKAVAQASDDAWALGRECGWLGVDGWQIKGGREGSASGGRRGADMRVIQRKGRRYCGIAGFFIGVATRQFVGAFVDGVLGKAEGGVARYGPVADPLAMVRTALGKADLSLVVLPAAAAALRDTIYIAALPASLKSRAPPAPPSKLRVPVADPVDLAPLRLQHVVDAGAEALDRLLMATRLADGTVFPDSLDAAVAASVAYDAELHRLLIATPSAAGGWPLRLGSTRSVPAPPVAPSEDEWVGPALADDALLPIVLRRDFGPPPASATQQPPLPVAPPQQPLPAVPAQPPRSAVPGQSSITSYLHKAPPKPKNA